MQRSGFVYVLIFLTITGIGAVLSVLITSHEVESSGWRAFDVVVVPDDVPQADVHRKLAQAGFDPIDRTNATVQIEDFNGQAALPIADIGERFDPSDPRIDPFVAEVGSLFTVIYEEQPYSVTYLPRPEKGESTAGRYRKIRNALGDIPFFTAGRQPVSPVPASIVVGLILFGVVIVSRRRILLSSLIAVSATAYVLLFGVAVAMPATITAIVAMYTAFHSESIEHEWLIHRGPIVLRREQFFTFVLFVLGIIISVVAVVLNPDPAGVFNIIGYFGYLAVIGVWYAIAIAMFRTKLHRSEHRLFFPRPILGERWRPHPRGPELFPGMITSAVVMLVGLGVLFFVTVDGRGGELYVPTPEHLLGEPDTPRTAADGVELLNAVGTIDPWRRPLSTAGFISHRRYQDSLLYGGDYGIPLEGETVDLQRFRRTDGGIEAWNEERLRFDGAWVLSTFDTVPGSVYFLFAREGGVFTVVDEPLIVADIPKEYVMTQLLLLFLFVSPLLLPIRLPYRNTLDTVAIASRSERR